MELITSKDNKTVKTARSLTAKKYRRKLGLFLAEGLRTVVDLLPTGTVKSVLLRSDSPTAVQLSAELQAVAAQAEAAGCQVMAVVPAVYATLEGTVNGLGLEGVRTLATQAGLPCVAIGGIDETRAARLRGTGVIGICVVSAICSAHDPQAGARQLLAAFAGTAA